MELNQSDPAYRDAMRLYLSGEWSGAESAFESLSESYPESTFVKLIQGNISYSLGNLDEAVDFYNQALDLDPNFGFAHYKLGVCYYRMGRLQQSLEAFEKVAGVESQSHAMASYFIGLINLFLGHDERAAAAFETFREKSPESMIANFYLAQLKIKRKEYEDARTLLSELAEATPDFAEVHYMLGVTHYGLHNNTEAIQCFRKALELNPEDERSKTKLTLLTEVQWP
jgi:tetratricopeptide (TPR) repeat protein